MADPLCNPHQPAMVQAFRRGYPLIAWLIIVMVCTFELVWPLVRPGKDPAAIKVRTGHFFMQVQVRLLVGMSQLKAQGSGALLFDQANPELNTGPLRQRLDFIVLAGELKGPSEALEQFNLVQEEMAQQDLEPSPEEAKLLILLQKLYQDYQEGKLAGPSLTDSDRELLVQNLGWCGKLALAPRGGPDPQVRQGLLRSTRLQVLVLIGTLGMVALFGLFGFFGLVVLLSFLAAKRLRPFMSRPLGYGGVYAEGFAVYMVVFLGLGLGESLLPLPRGNLWLPGLNMLLALGSGLAWPVLRGIPWPQVRRDLGLTLGRKPALEGWIGLGGYALTIPIFVLGTLVTLVLVNLHKRLSLGGPPQQNFAPIDQPSHPIIDWVSSGNSMVFVQIVVLAVILAPLVEETMFRGMLYRHLREATTRWGRFGSFLASASLVSLLFAGIHPQGWKAVPALMGLALGMNLLREWRGSLLPSMMVHGIHNGLMTLMLIVAVQG